MAGLLAGVDLGGTSIKAALADESGRVLAREVIPTESHQGPDGVLARIADLLERLGPDRAVVRFSDEADVAARREALVAVIGGWIARM